MQTVEIKYQESQDNITQPWVLLVSGKEVFRANTYSKCERHLAWKDYQKDSRSERLGWRKMSNALGAVILATSTVLILSSSALAARTCPKGVGCRDWCRVGEAPPKCRDGSGSGSFAARRQKEKDEEHRGRGRRELKGNKPNRIQTAPLRPTPRLSQPQPKRHPQICTKNQARACIVPKAIYNQQPPNYGQPDSQRGSGTR